MTLYPLGRVKNHDPRSRLYPFDTSAAAPTLVSVRHQRMVPVLDQGDLGSCTGNAAVGALGTEQFYDIVKDIVKDFSENTAKSVYSDAEIIDGGKGLPSEDEGSSGISVAKVLKNRGWISGYTHTFAYQDTLTALSIQPVIIGVNWYNNFFTPDANGVISKSKNDYVAGGHEFVLDELDMENQRVGATNSWNTDWGVDGRFYIPFALLKQLLAEEGDCTAFVEPTQPAPQPTPQPEPVPVPSPSPEPIPTPVQDIDLNLWKTLEDWSHAGHTGSNKKAATAVKAWAKQHGYTS